MVSNHRSRSLPSRRSVSEPPAHSKNAQQAGIFPKRVGSSSNVLTVLDEEIMSQAASSPSRTAVDLNGDWGKYVHGKLMDTVTVPSSLRPSGLYRLRRNFLLPRLSNIQRAFAHFDAINYHGRVFVNGQDLGTTI